MLSLINLSTPILSFLIYFYAFFVGFFFHAIPGFFDDNDDIFFNVLVEAKKSKSNFREKLFC